MIQEAGRISCDDILRYLSEREIISGKVQLNKLRNYLVYLGVITQASPPEGDAKENRYLLTNSGEIILSC